MLQIVLNKASGFDAKNIINEFYNKLGLESADIFVYLDENEACKISQMVPPSLLVEAQISDVRFQAFKQEFPKGFLVWLAPDCIDNGEISFSWTVGHELQHCVDAINIPNIYNISANIEKILTANKQMDTIRYNMPIELSADIAAMRLIIEKYGKEALIKYLEQFGPKELPNSWEHYLKYDFASEFNLEERAVSLITEYEDYLMSICPIFGRPDGTLCSIESICRIRRIH